MTAENVPGMMLPVLPTPTIDGLSIYRKPDAIADRVSRGSLTGVKVISLTYIFEQVGDYQLPEHIFYWWHPSSKEINQALIAGASWRVSDNNSDFSLTLTPITSCIQLRI